MIETCQPYGCSLVAIFGFCMGTALLVLALVAVNVFHQAVAAWRRWRLAVLQDQIDEVYPNWRNTVQSAHYNAWLRVQPKETLELAASLKVPDALEILRRYEASRT